MSKIEKFLNRLLLVGGSLIVGGVGLNAFCFVVQAGHSAILFDKMKGVGPKVYGEGLNFRIPILQTPQVFETRARPHVIRTSTGTRDLQTVNIALRILHRPEVNNLTLIYLNLGLNYDDKILPPISNEVLKSVVAQYNADQLLIQREQVSRDIREILSQRAKEFCIQLDDVSIIDIEYSPEFTKAIEDKQVAQQSAEKAKFIVTKTEEEKKATIIRSEGEAKAAELINQSIEDYGSGLIAIRKIEAAKHIAEVLAKSPNISFVTGNTINLLNLDKS